MSGNRTIVLTQKEVTLVAESWHLPACHREQPGFLHEAVLAVQCYNAVRYCFNRLVWRVGPQLFRHMLTRANQSPITRSFLLYTGSLFLLLVVGLLVSDGLSASLDSRDIIGLIAFSVLALLAESFPLRVPLGNAYIGVSDIIYISLIITLGPIWATVSSFTVFVISDIFINRKHVLKALFNATQTGLSVLAAGYIFLAIAGSNVIAQSIQFYLGIAIAIVVFWIINSWLVSFAAATLYNENAYRFWGRNFKWSLVYELTSAPIALGVSFAYQELWLPGLLLVTLPILMVRLAYSQYLELKKTYRETVRTLVKVIEMHDPYTAGHSDRVATYARQLCESLHLSTGLTERIELAAFLHDLGKIHLDLSNIIRKAGKLNEEERRLIRLHSVVSADLANQVSYFKGEIEAMIRHHHENWDGTGYPHGLKGEQIPLGSRIILLADAFDAMTTSRVYRDALDLDKVKDEFRKFAGIQFDPRLVPVFLDQVVGDGSGLLRQPMDEPLEGQRARMEKDAASAPQVRDIKSRVIG